MTDDPIKAAEQRGYSRGYAAGRKRKVLDVSQAERQTSINANWNRAFLAALPTCIEVDGWTRGDKPIDSLAGRTKLAAEFADEAVKYMRITP